MAGPSDGDAEMLKGPARLLSFSFLGLAAAAAVSPAFQVPDQDPAAQVVPTPPPFGGDATLSFAGMGGNARPVLPAAGGWAEVIMANNRWLVIQNEEGQQFPISYDSIRQYFVRWPANTDDATPNSLVEVTGVDIGSNGMRTDHIDIYEDNARTLVSPTFLRLVGYNRVYTAIDVDLEQTYGIYFPLNPGEYAIPRRLHVVGPILNREPLRLAVEGNNAVTVFPAPTGVTVTRVTVGSPSVAKTGDMVYFIPEDAAPKSLQVSQLVLYKSIPYQAFGR